MNESQRRFLAEGEQAGMRYSLGLPRRTLAGGAGVAVGQRSGSSLEFRDYRGYEPGDDLRHVDWAAYARTDQLSVKLFREEVTPHADIVLDGSRSMALEGSDKERAALALAAFFAAAAGNAGYTHRTWHLADEMRQVANGTGPPTAWDGLTFEYRLPPGAALTRGPGWRPRGLRVLLSDLLWDVAPLAVLRSFADRAAVAVVVQVLAQADVDPPEGGTVRLVDSETEDVRDLFVDAVSARRYRESLRLHQQNWHQACRQTGAVFASVVAEDVVRGWKLDELVAADVLKIV
jgi:uncharacterized protein (DUF58 family)